VEQFRVVAIDGGVDMVQRGDGTCDAALESGAIGLGEHE
jgi:hypothetical protein